MPRSQNHTMHALIAATTARLMRLGLAHSRARWRQAINAHDPRGFAMPVTPHCTVRRNEPCPCNSGRKFKQCCRTPKPIATPSSP